MTLTSSCLLQHRQLLMCRRATLGTSLCNKLSNGVKDKCLEKKIDLIDGLLNVLCNYNPDATLNCLTEAETCTIINYCYTLMPESC